MAISLNRHAKAIGEVENFHFWHGPRRSLFVSLFQRHASVGANVLEIGCGTGALSRELRGKGFAITGVDLAPSPGADDAGWLVAGDGVALPWVNESFEVVCCFDVLEHLDDNACLTEISRVLKPGGLLLASVPAFQRLWSARDVAAGHLRRYGRREFRNVLENAGFGVENLFGFQCFLLPVVALSRWYQRLRGSGEGQLRQEDRPGPVVNAVFRFINVAEVAIGRLLRPPVGSSLVAVVRKHGS